jgi:hypothetical protein
MNWRRAWAIYWVLAAAYVFLAPGRPWANAHPAIRHGGGCWY